jgi:hypothetical protein
MLPKKGQLVRINPGFECAFCRSVSEEFEKVKHANYYSYSSEWKSSILRVIEVIGYSYTVKPVDNKSLPEYVIFLTGEGFYSGYTDTIGKISFFASVDEICYCGEKAEPFTLFTSIECKLCGQPIR